MQHLIHLRLLGFNWIHKCICSPASLEILDQVIIRGEPNTSEGWMCFPVGCVILLSVYLAACMTLVCTVI